MGFGVGDWVWGWFRLFGSVKVRVRMRAGMRGWVKRLGG